MADQKSAVEGEMTQNKQNSNIPTGSKCVKTSRSLYHLEKQENYYPHLRMQDQECLNHKHSHVSHLFVVYCAVYCTLMSSARHREHIG